MNIDFARHLAEIHREASAICAGTSGVSMAEGALTWRQDKALLYDIT